MLVDLCELVLMPNYHQRDGSFSLANSLTLPTMHIDGCHDVCMNAGRQRRSELRKRFILTGLRQLIYLSYILWSTRPQKNKVSEGRREEEREEGQVGDGYIH